MCLAGLMQTLNLRFVAFPWLCVVQAGFLYARVSQNQGHIFGSGDVYKECIAFRALGFLKSRVPLLGGGVPIMRIIRFWCVSWFPLIYENSNIILIGPHVYQLPCLSICFSMVPIYPAPCTAKYDRTHGTQLLLGGLPQPRCQQHCRSSL